MEIKGAEQWLHGYQVKENVGIPLPGTADCPEGVLEMRREKTYTVDSFPPRSCFPVSLTEEQLQESHTRESDPWGSDMTALQPDECCWTCRMFDVWSLASFADIALTNMSAELATIKAKLQREDPEAAELEVSLLLNQKGKIEITGARTGILDAAVIKLSKLSEQSFIFQENLNQHTKAMSRLLDIFGSNEKAEKYIKKTTTMNSYASLMRPEANTSTNAPPLTESQKNLIDIRA
jgi:hypothetical protein